MRYKITLDEIKTPLEVYFTPLKKTVDGKEDWYFVVGEGVEISIPIDTNLLEM